jgi:hypothetical protein
MRYQAFALRSREEYDRRLNWPAAMQAFDDRIRPLLQKPRPGKEGA